MWEDFQKILRENKQQHIKNQYQKSAPIYGK